MLCCVYLWQGCCGLDVSHGKGNRFASTVIGGSRLDALAVCRYNATIRYLLECINNSLQMRIGRVEEGIIGSGPGV
jgi:hypothetical protein